MKQFIPVYQPSFGGNEKAYVNECLDTTWISSKGRFIPAFEQAFRDYIGVSYTAAVCNGTVAIHLALVALGIGPGDEVIVPTFTYIASVNPILYVGAAPVFVDSERASWQIDPADVRRKLTPCTRAIVVPHLYGHPADLDSLLEIARDHGLFVIEDCAEAFGSRFQGRHVGTFGDVATFSFFGNKTITTGEGGMVATNDATLYDRMVRYKGQGLAKHRTYWHDIVGYNYRMTNICAAIGLAQLERADDLIARKLALAAQYDQLLAPLPVETHRPSRADLLHTYWMYSVLVPEGRRDGLIDALAQAGVETRPAFYPVHTMPMYSQRYARHQVAEEIARRGINLPSWPDLSPEQVAYVVESLAQALQ
ncbi:MAG: DegT/DnrJ/EryC1/StrS aminotransferase family protein [Oscillochloris sp.]|nr:DegT/DnrJ/EryC1/StrS aminotransferase family protein [Oscillochloris sp.]